MDVNWKFAFSSSCQDRSKILLMFSFHGLAIKVLLVNGVSRRRLPVKPTALCLEEQAGLCQHLTAVQVTRLLHVSV